MKTRSRQPVDLDSPFREDVESNLDLEHLSEEELESLLFEEEVAKEPGAFNLPTVAGLSMILVGVAYLLERLGIFNGPDLSVLVSLLPWLGGILIILLGMGVLSWRPKRKQRVKIKKRFEMPKGKEKVIVEQSKPRKRKRLSRTRDKKLAGVAGGLAEYFGLDPTLVRIAFIISLFINGFGFLAYFILMFIMPKPDKMTMEERITIIRDS